MTLAALHAPARRSGRPPAAHLTPQKLNQVCALVERGVPQSAAAASVGIARRTWQVWLEKGREPGAPEPYASVAERLDEALSRWHASRVLSLEQVLGDEKADPRTRANVVMWQLERRFRDDWGAPDRGTAQVNVQVVVAQERSQAVEELLAAAGRALANDPGALERLVAELGGEVVVGEAVEVAELAAGACTAEAQTLGVIRA